MERIQDPTSDETEVKHHDDYYPTRIAITNSMASQEKTWVCVFCSTVDGYIVQKQSETESQNSLTTNTTNQLESFVIARQA